MCLPQHLQEVTPTVTCHQLLWGWWTRPLQPLHGCSNCSISDFTLYLWIIQSKAQPAPAAVTDPHNWTITATARCALTQHQKPAWGCIRETSEPQSTELGMHSRLSKNWVKLSTDCKTSLKNLVALTRPLSCCCWAAAATRGSCDGINWGVASWWCRVNVPCRPSAAPAAENPPLAANGSEKVISFPQVIRKVSNCAHNYSNAVDTALQMRERQSWKEICLQL